MSIADLDCLSMCSSCYFVVMYTAIKTADIVLMKVFRVSPTAFWFTKVLLVLLWRLIIIAWPARLEIEHLFHLNVISAMFKHMTVTSVSFSMLQTSTITIN